MLTGWCLTVSAWITLELPAHPDLAFIRNAARCTVATPGCAVAAQWNTFERCLTPPPHHPTAPTSRGGTIPPGLGGGVIPPEGGGWTYTTFEEPTNSVVYFIEEFFHLSGLDDIFQTPMLISHALTKMLPSLGS